jgi:DNA-binding LacI/PurR family transcriptional regulator
MSVRVTLQTIADQLGVSRTTVSNAYNRPDQLTPDLRDRILEAAEVLGYRGPDATGRMLRTGRIGAIGLVFTEDLTRVFSDPDTTLFIRGVAEATAQSGMGMTLLPIPPQTDLESTALRSAPVDGYVVYSVAEDHPALEVVLGRGVPVVVIDEPDLGARTSFVGIDDREGGRLAAEHLVALGHRRVGVLLHRLRREPVPGPVTEDAIIEAPVRVARERTAGYRIGLASAGIDMTTVPIWEAGGNDPDSGRTATAALLRAHPELTALLCSTDQVAIGAVQAILRSGRLVPRDVSVVGFDDVPRAATWEPALTTVRQPLLDKGRLAAELLRDAIESGSTKRVQLPIELIARASSGPARD